MTLTTCLPSVCFCTPAAANAALAEYEDDAGKMEMTAQEFAEEANDQLDTVEPIVAGEARQTAVVLAILSVLGTLIGARLADRWGHKNFLLISFGLASAVLQLLYFVSLVGGMGGRRRG